MNPNSWTPARNPFVRLAGDSRDGRAHGGRTYEQPEFVSRRVQVVVTDHPATDRWITLTTTYSPRGIPVWVVGVVDGFNKPTEPPEEFPTLLRARNYANKLYNAMTEEDR